MSAIVDAESALLQALADSSRDGLLALDEEGVIVAVNATAAALLNRQLRHLVGKPVFVLVDPSERQALREAFRTASASPARHTVAFHGLERPSTIVLRTTERRAPAHAVLTVLAPAADDRAPALDERTRTVHLDRFFDRFPHGVFGLDSKRRTLFANTRARELVGREHLEVGREFRSDAFGGEIAELAELLLSPSTVLPPTTLESTAGVFVQVTGMPAHGDQPAVLLVEDVTSARRHELAAQEFVRNAAHQLRTPLTALASAVEVLGNGARHDPVLLERFLGHIRLHTERLTRIARGMLVLARAGSGHPIRLDCVEIRPLLEMLASRLDTAPAVEVSIECPDDLSALAERDLLQEALAAIAENAAAHTAEGSIRLRGREESERIVIEIADTGVGILPEHRELVTQPFFRAQSSGQGFGLGLAIAAQAVAAMDGQLELAEAEKGTRMLVRLPPARFAA